MDKTMVIELGKISTQILGSKMCYLVDRHLEELPRACIHKFKVVIGFKLE
jgi:hypothetical protein